MYGRKLTTSRLSRAHPNCKASTTIQRLLSLVILDIRFSPVMVNYSVSVFRLVLSLLIVSIHQLSTLSYCSKQEDWLGPCVTQVTVFHCTVLWDRCYCPLCFYVYPLFSRCDNPLVCLLYYICQAGKSVPLHSFLPVERRQDDWCTLSLCFSHPASITLAGMSVGVYSFLPIIRGMMSTPMEYMGTSSLTLYASHILVLSTVPYDMDRTIYWTPCVSSTHIFYMSILSALLCGIALIPGPS